jgi:hypothetical protein
MISDTPLLCAGVIQSTSHARLPNGVLSLHPPAFTHLQVKGSIPGHFLSPATALARLAGTGRLVLLAEDASGLFFIGCRA